MTKPTKSQSEKWDRLREMGCVVCRNTGLGPTPPAIHHCHTGAGGRKDHDKVIAICHYHHQGKEGIHTIGRGPWEAKYGTEQQLMDQQNEELSLI